LHDVIGSVAPTEGPLLLGRSFLSRIKSWSIDNERHLLVLNKTSAGMNAPAAQTPAGVSAQSVQWISLGAFANDEHEDFTDVSSIQIKGSIRQAWIKSVFEPHAAIDPESSTQRRIRYMVLRDECDCDDQMWREEYHHWVYEDGSYGASSERIKAAAQPMFEEWHPVAPDIEVWRVRWQFVSAWKPK
jgi:hypothetical protein